MIYTDWIGISGVSLILLAYLLLLIRWVSAESPVYIIMNIAGAALACMASVLLNYVPFIILEAVWTFVSLLALVKLISKKYGRGEKSSLPD